MQTLQTLRIRLTPEQETQLQPLEAILKRDGSDGAGTIGQVLWYEDETVLLVAVAIPSLFQHVRRDIQENSDWLYAI